MKEQSKLVLITGATGFLGSALCRHFQERGYRVRALVRSRQKARQLEPYVSGGIYQCNLPDGIDEAAFQGDIAALIHTAYASQTADKKIAEAVNMRGSQVLLKLSRQYKVGRFIFISSLSAHDAAESYYGQSKLAIERMLDSKRDLIIRPGLIIGRGGLYQRMLENIRRIPIVPLFYGGKQKIQVIWIGDLCRAIETALANDLIGYFNIASELPVFIRDFYESIARAAGKKCHFIPLPGGPSLLLLRCLESMGLHLPVTSENLLGLKRMKVFPVRDDMKRLGVSPLSFDDTLGKMN